MNTTLSLPTLDDAQRATGGTLSRTEVRSDWCPMCGQSRKGSNKLWISHARRGDGLVAKCFSCGDDAPSRKILTALGLVRDDGDRPVRPAYRPEPREYQPGIDPYPGLLAPTGAAPDLPALGLADAVEYLTNIRTPGREGRVQYRNVDGRTATHRRWLQPDGGKAARNWGLKAHGWYPRFWLPANPFENILLIFEGEKDPAIACTLGYAAVSTPGGGNRAPSMIIDSIVAWARENRAMIVLCQDHDGPGHGWARELYTALRAQWKMVYRHVPVELPDGDSLADDPERLARVIQVAREHFLASCVVYPPPHPVQPEPLTTQDAKKSNKRVIERRPRPAEFQCGAGHYCRGTAAPDVDDNAYFTSPACCGKCENCLAWWSMGHWEKWLAGEPLPGRQSSVEFLGLSDLGATRIVERAQQQRTDCYGSPAFHGVRMGVRKRDSRNVDVVIFYRDGLSEKGERLTRKWAARKGIECVIKHGLTVARGDFDDVLIRKAVKGEDGRVKRLAGFWHWPVTYAKKTSNYFMGSNTQQFQVEDVPRRAGDPQPGRAKAVKVTGTQAALERYELLRKDHELGTTLNAVDWTRSRWFTEGEWAALKGEVMGGKRLSLPKWCKAPSGLVRDAILAQLGRKELRTAYLVVYERIGGPPGPPPEPVKGEPEYLTEVQLGLKRLERRLNASEMSGGGVSLIEPPASDEIGVEDYDAWDDWDVAVPDWDEECEPEDWRAL